MMDLEWLTRLPDPAFLAAQASSYDRRSKPGGDMFANGDFGQFVREEQIGARKEFVLADLKGPGAVTRIWSANPSGTLRMYFDGEPSPRLVTPMKDFLRGKVAPWTNAFAYEASRGCNIYFPFPYAKSLKITVDESDGIGKARGLYYHVNYRTYSAGTPTESYNPTDSLNGFEPFQGRKGVSAGYDYLQNKFRLSAKQDQEIAIKGPNRKIVQFSVKVDPPKGIQKAELARLMREILVEAVFDGEKCIDVPLGDFFASAPGINALNTWPVTVLDRELTTRFVMPFAKSAKFRFKNISKVPLSLSVQFQTGIYEWDDRSLHFHSQWTAFYGRTRPPQDMHLLDVLGRGYYVGTFLHVANPTPSWWGEGDEKVYVDGESFPSTFGTGTEDYFGYAWSSNERFERPYHAQPFSESPGNFGNSAVVRWHLFDPIPFTKSIKFDLELWHWQDVIAGYYRTVFWYSRPGGTPAVAPDRAKLVAPTLELPKPVPGALEGENLRVARMTGGKQEVQSGFWEISGGKQLWWTFMKPDDELELVLPVKPGTYEVIANCCFARDYGRHRISLGNAEPKEFDFFSDVLTWKKISLGKVTLTEASVKMKITCLGHNPKALAGNMFGLDYVLLKKVP